jgi:hypothetical protein
MKFDWRIQAASTTTTDIPAAYPGGPSHPAGSMLVMSSEVRPSSGKPVHFLTPSAVALALSIATQASTRAEKVKGTLSTGTAPSPDGIASFLGGDTGQLFDYFEQCFVAVVFSFHALEAYSNYKIAYSMKGDISFKRGNKTVTFSKAQVERNCSTSEKLSVVLPKLLKVSSPVGGAEWQAYDELKSLRNSMVHLKSQHQWSSADGFNDSPYAFFVLRSPLTIPEPAISMISYFATDHEQEWLVGSRAILEK